MPAPQSNAQNTRKVLWLANMTAIMFFAAIILFLPNFMQPLDLPDVQVPVLVLGLLSLPVAFLARRLVGIDNAREPIKGLAPTGREQMQKDNARFAVAGTLAELPAMFGLVYALVGGESLYALGLAAAALVATLVLKPE